MVMQHHESPQDDEESAFDTGSDFPDITALRPKNS
jgi:hypothetical protein